jgi:hypothetical protein
MWQEAGMLTWRQRRAARAIYEGVMTDEEICKWSRISAKMLAAWRGDVEFVRHLDALCEAAAMRTRCILSRNGPAAAMKLAKLIGEEKPDVARRAAMDLIGHCLKRTGAGEAAHEAPSGGEEMTEEEAKEMLKALIEEGGAEETRGAKPHPTDSDGEKKK